MDIEHNRSSHRFQTTLEDGVAYIEYDDSSEGKLDLQHTIVPEEHEGRGVGSELVRHVLNYARDNDLAVIPSCPFIATWITRHPDYENVVAG